MIALHTPEGIVLYANDFKLDNTPILGEPPNYRRLKELAKIGVKALIVDSLYAPDDRKTPSEKIARGLLEDVFFTTENKNSGMVITTFSSHIARLSSIAEFGRRLNREVVFLGRSLNKYMTAAKNIGKAPFSKDVRLITYTKQLQRELKQVNKNKKHFLVVCTGHQGEPGSILDRISRNELPYNLSKDDHVIFSSKTIPTPINEVNREQLERRLKKHQVRIFDNVHVSGHGGREDLRDLIKITNPQHVIPSHGDLKKLDAGAKLAEEMGYVLDKTVHVMQNGKFIEIK
jgi:ribonuclease J